MKGCSKDNNDGKECGKDAKDHDHSIYYAEKNSNKLMGSAYFDKQNLLARKDFEHLVQDDMRNDTVLAF